MIRDTLVLLTAGFPYGSLETFIDAEIPYLANSFKSVQILAVSDGPLSSKQREVPPNVSITCIDLSDPVAAIPFKVKCTWRFILSELFDCIWHYRIFPLRAVWNSFYGTLRNAESIASCIEAHLKSCSVDPGKVVIYSYWMSSAALAACFLKRRFPSIRAVSRCHGWDVYFERNKLSYLPLRGFMLSSLDKLYCISGDGATYLDKKTSYKFSPKIEVRHLASPITQARTAVRDCDGVLRFVSCSWVEPLKRLNLIVDTIEFLGVRHPNIFFEWTHLGGGDDLNKISIYASANLGPLANVKYFFTGKISNGEIIEFYRNESFDVFLSSSEWEGLPVSMMEAASFGIPIVATDVGGVSEIVADGVNGYLLRRDAKAEEFSSAIEKFLKMSGRDRLKFRRAARSIWQHRFNPGENFRNWAEEISQL